jgi:DNA-binding CsgD family transcriptional regulator
VSNQATGEMMCLAEDDESFIRCSEFYHDVLLPFDLRYVMCTSLRPRGNIIPTIGIHRSPAQGGFDGAHIEILRRVVRHLGKVVTLQQAKLERERIEALAGKEACPFALFVTNALGKLLFANPLAEELLLAGEGMKLRGGHLGAEDPKDAARLHGAINAAVPTARVRSKAVGTALRIRRSAGRQPLLALVGPLAASRLTALPPEPLAIVLVSDPERRPMLIGKHLMEWFGLTAAEAQLALRLAEGYRLEDVAVERDIRLSTLRSQLSAILGKTNTDRQSALVGLLSRLPANPRSAGQTGAAANRGADYG